MIGRVPEAAACANKFKKEGVSITLSVTPCWCSGKIDAEWRLVKIMENGNLPNGNEFEHPECSAIINNGKIYMFCRNTDRCIVPLVFISEDNAETWKMYSHDIPFADSKIYSGTLSDGRNYVIGSIMPDRKKLAILFSKKGTMHFDKAFLLADNQCFNDYNGQQWSYPCAMSRKENYT